jgi:prepilin-type processing-associated H-X9-DG protein
MILPPLEQGALFNAINFSYEYSPYGQGDISGVPVNTTVAISVVSAYVCPTNGLTAYYNYGAGHTSLKIPYANYMASAGVTIRPGCSLPSCHGCAVCNAIEGAMYEYGVVKLSDIRDGASNTLVLGEVGVGGDWFAGWRSEVQRVSSAGINRPWPNPPGMCSVPDDENAPLDGPQPWIGFGSYHPGGANFAFCDGSVKFLKSTSDLGVLSALGTRAGGEVVSASEY